MTEQAHDHHAHGHDDGASFDPETMDWDARYRSEDGAMWSGHVNGTLVDEIGDLPPGSALDVGCGEGADAIWLAQQGWTVTALDVAPTAVERGRAEAERQGVDGIDWIAGDLLADPPNGTFDLVSLQYPAFPISRRDQLSEVLRTAVAPGGVLCSWVTRRRTTRPTARTTLPTGHNPPISSATWPMAGPWSATSSCPGRVITITVRTTRRTSSSGPVDRSETSRPRAGPEQPRFGRAEAAGSGTTPIRPLRRCGLRSAGDPQRDRW